MVDELVSEDVRQIQDRLVLSLLALRGRYIALDAGDLLDLAWTFSYNVLSITVQTFITVSCKVRYLREHLHGGRLAEIGDTPQIPTHTTWVGVLTVDAVFAK